MTFLTKHDVTVTLGWQNSRMLKWRTIGPPEKFHGQVDSSQRWHVGWEYALILVRAFICIHVLCMLATMAFLADAQVCGILNWLPYVRGDTLISEGYFMRTKHLCVLDHIRTKDEVGTIKHALALK